MRTLLLTAALLAPLLLTVPAANGVVPMTCFTYESSTTVAETDDASLHVNSFGGHLLRYPGLSGETRYYVSDYNYFFWFSFWFYAETNGVPGLQREDDSCRDCPAADCGDEWMEFLV